MTDQNAEAKGPALASEITASETLHEGFFRVRRYRMRYQRFAGGWMGPVGREVFERGPAVGLLPWDIERDRLVLIEQFRPGAEIAGRANSWLLEVPAGMIEAGEDAATVAARELTEETGLTLLGTPIFCCDYMTSPGGSDETLQLYVGRVDSEKAGGIHGLDDEHEDIRVLVLDRSEALAMADRGAIDNATALVALYYLDRHAARLRRELEMQR